VTEATSGAEVLASGMPLRRCLDDGAARLRGAGIDAPRDAAVRIAAALFGATPGAVRMREGETVPSGFTDAFQERVARRAGGEPLAYVCGEIGFRHLELRCDRRALIPRPETELLVELALAECRAGTALDVGTGTGCLALSLAHEGAFQQVLALDRSPEAVQLARENAVRVASRTPVRFVVGDLVSAVRDATVNLLVSNPPYLTTAEWDALDASVKAWEPRLALPSGEDGLAATRTLLDEGRRVVVPGGWIVLELDCRRAAASAAIAAAFGWTDVAVHHDLFARERFLLARRSSR
jgi:release factor glutamine methyltransferase